MKKGETNIVSISACVLTLAIILVALSSPDPWLDNFSPAFAVALLLAGIPHGAADHLIFQLVARRKQTNWKISWFYAGYLGVAALYAALWWAMPWLALLAFLMVSAYHFGQSNWSRIQIDSPVLRTTAELLWGTAVIAVPVLLHRETSFVIIEEITGSRINLPETVSLHVTQGLVAANACCLAVLGGLGLLDKATLLREAAAFALLMLLFLATPLLVGFSVYFVFWHSLGSVRDQVEALRNSDPAFGIGRYALKVAPFSVLALAGLALMYAFLGDMLDRGANLGVLFLFVAIITVPHSLLMSQFYGAGNTQLQHDGAA